MGNKVLSIFITIIFANLLLGFWEKYTAWEFLPLAESLAGSRISAYDFFLLISVICLRFVASRFGISLTTLRNSFRSLFAYHGLTEILIMAGTGLITHLWIWPVTYQILHEPIAVINQSPDAIKKTVIMSLPIFWALLIGLIGGGISMPYKHQQMPSPPGWQP